MPDLEFTLVDETNFDEIPLPAQPGARCQTCDYWERLDGGREQPGEGTHLAARATLKRNRLLAARTLAGSYAMLAYRVDAVQRTAVGYAQFGPISAYPRAQSIRDRYPQLPESPPPWVVTCLQVSADVAVSTQRESDGIALLEAVCDELDRRGIIAVEAYPEGVPDPWLPSPGPASVYAAAGFERAAGDERFPVFRRELSGETDADAWSGLLRAAEPADDDEAWPLPLPKGPSEDDLFRLPERPKRPNPFGDA
ncbi:MAG: hypothetical protein ABI841_03210 [Chloroflexota bacterium]